eukprot:2169064-Rhodomonas_salina.1
MSEPRSTRVCIPLRACLHSAMHSVSAQRSNAVCPAVTCSYGHSQTVDAVLSGYLPTPSTSTSLLVPRLVLAQDDVVLRGENRGGRTVVYESIPCP